MSKLYTTDKLVEWRVDRGYTQTEMAQLFGLSADKEVSLSTYQKWEQGNLNISPDMALELSRFTKIELKDLVVRR